MGSFTREDPHRVGDLAFIRQHGEFEIQITGDRVGVSLRPVRPIVGAMAVVRHSYFQQPNSIFFALGSDFEDPEMYESIASSVAAKVNEALSESAE